MAVAIDGGLITPTIIKAQEMDLFSIGRTWKELVDKAKNKKLTPAEYTSGTFTISNLGRYPHPYLYLYSYPYPCLSCKGGWVDHWLADVLSSPLDYPLFAQGPRLIPIIMISFLLSVVHGHL